jgi:4-aminobutyrate aminotransferase-like enzyme
MINLSANPDILTDKTALCGPNVVTEIPGPRSKALWNEEEKVIGPGLQTVVQWSQMSFQRGEGPFLFDVDGNAILDFMGGSGVNSIGHSHPRFVKAVTEKLSKITIGAFTSKARIEMLEMFKKILPPELDRVQLYTGGAEAVEAALRLAKSYTKKYEFLSFWNGYHGKSLGALGLTDGAKKGFGPMAPGNLGAPYANCYHCAFKLEFPTCEFACVNHVREVIQHESAGSLAAIIVEPIQGRLGNVAPPPGYLKALKQVAHEMGALLIMDETMTCLGRTGKMFAFEYDGIVPDIVIMGKGLGAGYPVTAIASSSKIMAERPFSEPSASSSSFGGFPVACEAVKTTLQIVIEEKLSEKAAVLGKELFQMLQVMEKEIPLVGRVHGQGLMLGIELVEDKEKRKPLPKPLLKKVFQALLREGVLVMLGGNSFRLYPALNIDREIAIRGVQIIGRVLREQSKLFEK